MYVISFYTYMIPLGRQRLRNVATPRFGAEAKLEGREKPLQHLTALD